MLPLNRYPPRIELGITIARSWRFARFSAPVFLVILTINAPNNRFLITILDLVAGDSTFTDITGQAFRGGYAPSRANPAGRVSHSPHWGTRP